MINMPEKLNQENALKLMNLYTINAYIQKMLVSKTDKICLSKSGEKIELTLLKDFSNLVSLKESSN